MFSRLRKEVPSRIVPSDDRTAPSNDELPPQELVYGLPTYPPRPEDEDAILEYYFPYLGEAPKITGSEAKNAQRFNSLNLAELKPGAVVYIDNLSEEIGRVRGHVEECYLLTVFNSPTDERMVAIWKAGLSTVSEDDFATTRAGSGYVARLEDFVDEQYYDGVVQGGKTFVAPYFSESSLANGVIDYPNQHRIITVGRIVVIRQDEDTESSTPNA